MSPSLRKLTLFLTALIVAPLAGAQSLEALRAAAESRFLSVGAEGVFLRVIGSAPALDTAATGARPHPHITRYLKDHIHLVAPEPGAGAPFESVATIDLDLLLNRQVKSKLVSVIGGQNVWISGAFDRGQNAHSSILVEGYEPLFFNFKTLLDQEQLLRIGSQKYKLYLSPNIFSPMGSAIVLENASKGNEELSLSLKKLLDAILEAGEAVTVGGQAYRVFYYDDIAPGGAGRVRDVVFMTEVKREFHIFIVNDEDLPADEVGSFKMVKEYGVGLRKSGNTLHIYQ